MICVQKSTYIETWSSPRKKIQYVCILHDSVVITDFFGVKIESSYLTTSDHRYTAQSRWHQKRGNIWPKQKRVIVRHWLLVGTQSTVTCSIYIYICSIRFSFWRMVHWFGGWVNCPRSYISLFFSLCSIRVMFFFCYWNRGKMISKNEKRSRRNNPTSPRNGKQEGDIYWGSHHGSIIIISSISITHWQHYIPTLRNFPHTGMADDDWWWWLLIKFDHCMPSLFDYRSTMVSFQEKLIS